MARDDQSVPVEQSEDAQSGLFVERACRDEMKGALRGSCEGGCDEEDKAPDTTKNLNID